MLIGQLRLLAKGQPVLVLRTRRRALFRCWTTSWVTSRRTIDSLNCPALFLRQDERDQVHVVGWRGRPRRCRLADGCLLSLSLSQLDQDSTYTMSSTAQAPVVGPSDGRVTVTPEYIIGPEQTPFYTCRWAPANGTPRAYLLFVHGKSCLTQA